MKEHRENIESANDSMRYFINKELDLLFEDYMSIESKEEYIDANNMLAIDVYAKAGYGDESPLICFTFAIGHDLTPMIVMCEDPEIFEEPEREYIYMLLQCLHY